MALALGAYALSVEPDSPAPVASAPYSELHGRVFEAFGGAGSVEGRPVGRPGGPPALAGKESAASVPATGLGFAGQVPAPSRRLLEVHARVEALLRGDPGPRDLATAASFHLLRGDAREATTLLERASEAAPDDGRFLADLALARRELALREGIPFFLVAALEAALRASEHDAAPPEAGFNLALILEDLGLSNRAREAWEAYLHEAPASPWTSLARERLAGIGARGVEGPARSPGEDGSWAPGPSTDDLDRRIAATGAAARLHAEGTLFPRWAEAVLGNDARGAARLLDRLRRIGDALVRTAGDPLIRDAVRAIDGARRSPAGAQPVEELAAGHRAQAEGRSTVLQEGCDDPGAPLSRAEDHLVRAGSPFAGWAAVDRAVCAYYGGRYDDAWRHLDRASVAAAGGGYSALAARVLWISGLVAMVEGDLARSLGFYEDAVRLFDALGETEHAAYLHALVAKDLRLLGAPEEAWTHRIQALRARHLVPGADRSYTILQEAAEAVQDDGRHPRAAAVFLDELVAVAEGTADLDAPDLVPLALLQRAKLSADLGWSRRASRDLQQVQEHLAALPDSFQTQALLRLKERSLRAELNRKADPERSLLLLHEVIRFHSGLAQEGAPARPELVAAHHRRAEILQALGRREEALFDLRAGVAEAMRQQDRIGDPGLRVAFRKEVASLYERLVQVQLEMGRAAEALDTVDESRLWLVRDLLARDGVLEADASVRWRPVSATDLVEGLPQDVVLVEYAVLEDRTVRWVVQRGSLEVSSVPLGRREARHLVGAFRDAVERGAPAAEVQSLGSRLHAVLLPDVEGDAFPAELVFVPGPELSAIPFGALYDAAAGRFLVEQAALVVAPAAATVLGGDEPPVARARTGALVVTDPAFDRVRHPALETLPGASGPESLKWWSREHVQVLRGGAATEEALLDSLGLARIFHFAGHAVVNPEGAGRTGLLLAPGAPGRGAAADGLLEPGDLARADLRGMDLVVLAGCNTALGAWSGATEIAGLAAAFQAAGARSVVASLWRVDDAAAARFTNRLYAGVLRGLPAHQALRDATLQAIREANPTEAAPLHWAAYQVFGLP